MFSVVWATESFLWKSQAVVAVVVQVVLVYVVVVVVEVVVVVMVQSLSLVSPSPLNSSLERQANDPTSPKVLRSPFPSRPGSRDLHFRRKRHAIRLFRVLNSPGAHSSKYDDVISVFLGCPENGGKVEHLAKIIWTRCAYLHRAPPNWPVRHRHPDEESMDWLTVPWTFKLEAFWQNVEKERALGSTWIPTNG